MDITYRFLTEDEIVDVLNPVMAEYGWAMLNTGTSQVLGAFDGPLLVKALALQLYPMLGPMVNVSDHRDDGAVSRKLAEEMDTYLRDSNARGWMAICDSPVTERLCQRYEMKRVEVPVYVFVPKERG